MPKQLAGELIKLRKKRNLSLVEASKLSGVSLTVLSDFESGKKEGHPIVSTLEKLARAYNADIKDILKLK